MSFIYFSFQRYAILLQLKIVRKTADSRMSVTLCTGDQISATFILTAVLSLPQSVTSDHFVSV